MFTNFIFQFDRQEFNIMYLRFKYIQGIRKTTVRLKLLFELSNKHEKRQSYTHTHLYFIILILRYCNTCKIICLSTLLNTQQNALKNGHKLCIFNNYIFANPMS